MCAGSPTLRRASRQRWRWVSRRRGGPWPRSALGECSPRRSSCTAVWARFGIVRGTPWRTDRTSLPPLERTSILWARSRDLQRGAMDISRASQESSEDRSDPFLRRERAILAGILVLALTVRLVFVLQMRSSPFFDHPALDQGLYVEAGRAVAAGHELRPGPFFRPPLYGWWLGLVFKLFGDGLLLPRLLQSVLGTATVWLVYRVGKLAFDARARLAAALFASTYWVLVYYDRELLREPIANPLNLVGVLAAIQPALS